MDPEAGSRIVQVLGTLTQRVYDHHTWEQSRYHGSPRSASTFPSYEALGMVGGKIHGPGKTGKSLGVSPNTTRPKMRKLSILFR